MRANHPIIGILGGTFDPIHNGHLRMALEAHEQLKLNKVHLIPAYQPVHRPLPIASIKERLAMLALAVQDASELYVDTREIERKKPSYTIDTLEEMHAEMPYTTFCLLMGVDAFLDFPSWKRFDEILNIAHIVVAHRPSFQLPATGILADMLQKHLQNDAASIQKNQAGGIVLLPITALEISASSIRKQIAMGGNPRYLLPDNVYNYIKQQGIYKNET